MPFDYEALVGHLYLVGGRSLRMLPPGSLVEVAPKKAARGRELDTFFTLVVPSGDATAPIKFYEQMARLSADRFFETGGSVTSALRSVLTSINQDLLDHNAQGGLPYEANVIFAVLRGSDLYIGRVGSGVAVLRHKGEVVPFPASFDNDDALFGPPLGVLPIPSVKMSHYEVEAGTRLIFGDPALADADFDLLKDALGAGDINAVLHRLERNVLKQAMLTIVEFVPPEVEMGVAAVGGSTAVLAGGEAPPPMEPGDMLINAFDQVQRTIRRGIAAIASGIATIARLLNRLLDHFFPPPEEGERGRGGPMIAGLVLLMPLIIVGLVLLLWLTGTGESEFEACYRDTIETATLARSINSADVGGTIEAWNAVLANVERCEELRPEDPDLTALKREAQIIIDRLNVIERRQVQPVAAFPNAALSRLVLRGLDMYTLDSRNGLVYRVTLTEDGMNIVPNSRQIINTMRRGAAVNEFVMTELIDIAWANDGSGLSQGNVLIALDRNGVLVEYSPTFLARGAQRLLGTENWVNPVKITVWQGRLYVLDPGAGSQGQIWRYEPSGGAFAAAPSEYFAGANRPNISTAVDFGIDNSGAVYVLLENGILNKFITGEAVNFGFASFPDGQQLESAAALFLNDDPVSPGLYIVNRDNRTIYETSLAGTFFYSYRAFDEEIFGTLSGVVADTNQQIIYALSGNSIVAFNRTR